MAAERRPKHRPECAASATVLPFVSRARALELRGQRRFGAFMSRTGPYNHPDERERARLQQERMEDDRRDEQWKLRHGPVPGGAVILLFRSTVEDER
jgi:hypothetical protein